MRTSRTVIRATRPRALIDQIERFAPGLRERILATAVRSTSEIASHNANYIGGDIITGANTPWQTVIRPRLALDPYSTGIPGVFICSAATPPGAGAPRDERLQLRTLGTCRPKVGVSSSGSLIGRFRRARRDPSLAVLEGFHALKHALRFDARLIEIVASDAAELEQLAAVLAPDLSARLLALAQPVEPSVFAQLAPLPRPRA